MTTHLNEAVLNALVDGELDDAARTRAEAHVATCARCAADHAALRALLHDVGALQRGVAPARDLLPGIHAAIDAATSGRTAAATQAHVEGRRKPRFADRSIRSVRWALAAAALALAALSATVTALLVRPSDRPLIATDTAVGVPAGELRRLEARFIVATSELEEVLDAERAQLAPETVRILEESLAIVDAALAEAREALAADPGNAALSEMLMATYEKKLDLLRSAAASVAS
jgi:anti-sigma factor RsiW